MTFRRTPGPFRQVLRWSLLLLLTALPVSVPGQTPAAPVDESRLHQVLIGYLINFANHVRWPQGDQNGDGVISIGLLDQNPLAGPLTDTVAGRTAQGHPLQVRELTALADLIDCELVFLLRPTEQRVREVCEAVADHPVLVIAFEAPAGRSPAAVDMMLTTDGTVGYKVAVNALRRARLIPSPGLLRYASRGSDREERSDRNPSLR